MKRSSLGPDDAWKRGPVRSLPRGYVLHRIGSSWLVFDRNYEDTLVQLRLADPAVRKRLFAHGPRRGRGVTPTVPLGNEASMVLRRYRHGGLFGGLLGPLFLGPGRALAELRVTARTEEAGAPVPHALCLVVWPRLGPLWSAMIGTREETGATDVLAALRERPQQRERVVLARAVGAAFRRLHDTGLLHGDLQVLNVLVRPSSTSEPEIVIIDLDGARVHPSRDLRAGLRARDLGRFVRSVVKTGAWPTLAGRRELAALIGAYTGGDRTLRSKLRARVPVEATRLAFHRVGYWLGRLRRSSRGAAPPRRA